jgi:ATP-dependent DNA helicase HFM1/MER3
VLCTTSTLAMGMNLPAHLVIVKGTRRYVGSEAQDASGYEEYERSTCLQVANGVLEVSHAAAPPCSPARP